MKNLILGIFLILFCVSNKAQNVQTYDATTTLSCDGGAILIDSLQFESWTWFADDSMTVIQQNGSYISGLCLGNYVLQLTSNGSNFYYSFTISANPVDCSNFQTSYNIYPNTDYFSCNGSIDFININGTLPFTYQSQTISVINNSSGFLCDGPYNVIITDANGCVDSVYFYIPYVNPACVNITLNPSSINSSTNLSCNGQINLNYSGFTEPVSYSIMNNNQFYDTINLCPNSYTISINDVNGCFLSQTVVVNYDSLAVDCSSFQTDVDIIQHPSSPNINDGMLVCNLIGGTYPFTFNWNNGMTTQNADDVGVGAYEVCVTDGNGCVSCSNVYLDVDSSSCSNFSANIQLGQNATSTTINDAYVQVGFTGGTGPYAIYQLNDTIISADTTTYYLYNLSYGDFCFQVEDANGCITSACQYIGYGYDCSTFSVSTQTTDASTYISGCNGTTTIQIQNGTAPYYINNFQISGNTFTYTGLCPGITYFNVVDVNGCTFAVADSIGWNGDSLEIPPFVNIIPYTGNVSAEGNCDGSVYLQIIGGLSPYMIYDNNGIPVDQFQSGLCEGVYTNTVVDASGQTFTVNYFIASPFNIIDNTIFPDSLVLDTLINNVLQNCVIDFSTLDTAYISNIEFISMDSVVVTWTVLDGNGTIEFVENYSLDAGFGIYELIFQVFCPQRATDKYLIVREQFKVGGSFLGVKEQTTNFNVYPNPITDILNIQLDENFATTISISDVTGKIVYQNNFDTEFIQISTSEFAKGQYFVNVSNEGHTTTKIIVK